MSGEQIRTGKCWYGDGSKASNVRLCSERSVNMTELCETDNTMNSCKTDISTDGAVESDSGLHIGIGVVGMLLVILSGSLVILIHRRCEKDLFNQTDDLNSGPSHFEFAVAFPVQGVKVDFYETTLCSSSNNPDYFTVLR